MQISIIGAGQIGQAIAKTLKTNHNIYLWDKDPAKVPGQKQLQEIIPDSGLVFLCVPSPALREALTEVRYLLSPLCPIVSVTKGIESSGKFAHEVIAEILENDNFAILSGPMIAAELGQGLGGAGVVASKRHEIFDSLAQAFDNKRIVLSYSQDLRAVSFAGVLKNIYSMLVGISDGLGYGSNMRGMLMVKIVAELTQFVREFSLDRQVFVGPAGLGDLVATSMSENSMNHKAGRQLAAGEDPVKSEGLVSIIQMTKIVANFSKYPCLRAVNAIVAGADPKQVFENLVYAEQSL